MSLSFLVESPILYLAWLAKVLSLLSELEWLRRYVMLSTVFHQPALPPSLHLSSLGNLTIFPLELTHFFARIIWTPRQTTSITMNSTRAMNYIKIILLLKKGPSLQDDQKHFELSLTNEANYDQLQQ